MRIVEPHRPAHALTVGDRVGWERSGRSYTRRGDGAALTALRATSYVLTSLASLAFLALIVFAAVRLAQVSTLFAQLMP